MFGCLNPIFLYIPNYCCNIKNTKIYCRYINIKVKSSYFVLICSTWRSSGPQSLLKALSRQNRKKKKHKKMSSVGVQYSNYFVHPLWLVIMEHLLDCSPLFSGCLSIVWRVIIGRMLLHHVTLLSGPFIGRWWRAAEVG